MLLAITGVAMAQSTLLPSDADRPIWDIAPVWHCYFIQEFRCSSDAQSCATGAQAYNRDLNLDFGNGTISYSGGGTFPITNRQHLPLLKKSFFVQGQTEFFLQGGILWRTFLPRFAGTEFHLQAYRCSPQ
jgi:hypothetical protein